MRLLTMFALCLFAYAAHAQDKSIYKFTELKLSDFQPKLYSIDSNANAVILADVGSTSFIGNKKGWFTLVFKRHTRIRFLKQAAMDLATIRIPLYHSEKDEETLDNFRASTFNEVNGAIVETALDKHDVFTEKQDKNHTEKKFTLPGVKEGSIIDVTYTINSDFEFNLQPWTFQHISYPCLWSEYSVAVPQLLNYIFIKQGVNHYEVEKKDQGSETYHITESPDIFYSGASKDMSISAIVFKNRWAMKDVPAFRDVDWVASADNYLDRIEFQLSQVSDGETTRDVMNTWPKTTEELLKREDFGAVLTQDNFWLDEVVESVTKGSSDHLEAAHKIYDYVRKNFTCTSKGYFIKTSLEDVFKSRKGNSGEINLILMTMLRKMGIIANPVLISTRENGKIYKNYPIVSRFNYAFCQASINNTIYNLDACHPFLGFGKLDPECYYGQARIVNSAAESFDLSADSLKENKNILVIVVNEENGTLSGSVNKVPGYYESYHQREEIAEQGQVTFASQIKKTFSGDGQVDNIQLESLNDLNAPLSIHYEFSLKPFTAETLYFNPMFGEGYDKNIFKSEDRLYPVEMFFPANSTYALSLEIPKGYKVEELPASVMVKLNDRGDGSFEYRIQQNGNQISLRTRLVMKRTVFEAAEYDVLREFFNLVVKKQTEVIVFKKIN